MDIKKGEKYLYRHGYIISRKKVRSFMSENNLLNYLYSSRKPETRVINTVVNVNSEN